MWGVAVGTTTIPIQPLKLSIPEKANAISPPSHFVVSTAQNDYRQPPTRKAASIAYMQQMKS
jgi:hypothetical protein